MSDSNHLTEDQLLERLYGARSSSHECSECDEKLQSMQEKRAFAAARVEESADFFAAQRRQIYNRLGEDRRPSRIWAPATAAALCLAAAGLIGYHATNTIPAQPVHTVSHVSPAPDASSDAQLFSDVYSMEESAEPRAAAPIHKLFEEN
jgi:hypothetical protein